MTDNTTNGADNIKHTCVLWKNPKCDVPPTASWCQIKMWELRQLLMPCKWHHGTALYIRSWKRLRQERDRQARLGKGLACHPYSPVKYYWDCFHLFFMVIAFLYMPLQVFYKCPNPYDPLILFTDLCMFLNLCTRFFIGYFDNEQKIIVLKPKKIAIHYLKTHFIADLIAALPLQIITIYEDCEYPSNTIMFVVKLLRIMTLKEHWKNVLGQFQLSCMQYACVTTIVQLLMFFHWMTYIHYQVPSFFYHLYKMDDALMNWMKRINVVDFKNTPIIQKYTANLFFVFGLCIGAGYYNPVDQHPLPELIVSSTMGIVGLLFLLYSVTGLLRLAIYRQFETYLFNGRCKELEEYMAFMHLPKPLQKKINLFINYKHNGHYFSRTAIMHTINEQIKQDINMHCCKRLVMNVPLFQDMPVALINAIVFSLIRVLYMPGEIIIKFGEVGSSIYLISSGTVAVMNEEGREVAHLRDGAYFGENSLQHAGVLRAATIIALEITEIYRLDSRDFHSCLQPYSHLKRRIEETSIHRRLSTNRPRRA